MASVKDDKKQPKEIEILQNLWTGDVFKID